MFSLTIDVMSLWTRYFVGLMTRCQSPSRAPHATNWDSDQSENVHAKSRGTTKRPQATPNHSDSDSDDNQNSASPRAPGRPSKKKKHKNSKMSSATVSSASSGHRPSSHNIVNKAQVKLIVSGGGDGVQRIGHRWNPTRLSTSTKFVLGSKANKALGFAMTRGRLYTKHADLFRYELDAVLIQRQYN